MRRRRGNCQAIPPAPRAPRTAAADRGTSQKVPERYSGKWAILDDCTSAMDAAVEKMFFRYAASQGISVVSFSQRERAAVDENDIKACTRLLTLGTGVLGWELE